MTNPGEGMGELSNDEPPAATILCVRHPDFDNEYTVEGDAHVIDIDMGRSFDGRPESAEVWREWSSSVLAQVEDLPAESLIRQQVERLVEDVKP